MGTYGQVANSFDPWEMWLLTQSSTISRNLRGNRKQIFDRRVRRDQGNEDLMISESGKPEACGPCIPHPLGWGGRTQFDFFKLFIITVVSKFFVATAGFINKVQLEHNWLILCIFFVTFSWNIVSQCQPLDHTMNAKSKTWKLQLDTFKWIKVKISWSYGKDKQGFKLPAY